MSLIIAGVPIGNAQDASPRLINSIKSAQVIAAEDTRKFQRLCKDLGIEVGAKVVSYFEGNESERTEKLVAELIGGTKLLLVTDAGMPSVSDPGYQLVEAAIEKGIEVEIIPGPSAVTTAIAISGLPSEKFTFEGFLPRTENSRESELEKLRFEARTMVFFEAPHRIRETILAMEKIFGANRRACICRELTKTYEEIIRGNLNDLQNWVESKEMLGEFTIVVEGASKGFKEHTNSELVALVLKYEDAGMNRKEAIAEVATITGLPKRNVFSAMVEAKSPLE